MWKVDPKDKYIQKYKQVQAILKIPNRNRVGGVAQVVECLPTKCEALSQNPNIATTKNPS
jgi:hypothetical protein